MQIRSTISLVMLDYVHSMIIIADKHQSANMEWPNYQHVTASKYGLTQSTGNKSGAVAATFFDVVLEFDIYSTSPKKIVDCLKDKRIQGVRDYLKELELHSIEINERLRDEFLRAITAHGIAQTRKERLVGKGKSFLGALRDVASIVGDSIPGTRQIQGAAGKVLDAHGNLLADREIRDLKAKRELWFLLHEKLVYESHP
jgi:hypothetical protein